MPIHKYKKGNHYHIVVNKSGNDFASVGLTSDRPSNKKNQKLHLVYESNGKIARMKRNVTIDNKSKYSKKRANFNVDTVSEEKAYGMYMRKKAKKK